MSAYHFRQATAADFEACLALRLSAMRPSLEAVGRFTPERARARFAAQFSPDNTTLVQDGTALVALCCVLDLGQMLEIKHLYIAPQAQGTGLGTRLIMPTLAKADTMQRDVLAVVLTGAPAARFYERHGFAAVVREGVDVTFLRKPR